MALLLHLKALTSYQDRCHFGTCLSQKCFSWWNRSAGTVRCLMHLWVRFGHTVMNFSTGRRTDATRIQGSWDGILGAPRSGPVLLRDQQRSVVLVLSGPGAIVKFFRRIFPLYIHTYLLNL